MAGGGSHLPPSATWGRHPPAPGNGEGRLGLEGRNSGLLQLNTVMVSLRFVKVANNRYPNRHQIHDWIFHEQGLAQDPTKIEKIAHMRSEQAFQISFWEEEDADSLEQLVQLGQFFFPGATTGARITAQRLDNPTIQAKLAGFIPSWVKKDEVEELFGRMTTVVSCVRGTNETSPQGLTEEDWRQGWIWSGEWELRLKGDVDNLVDYVLAGGARWDIQVEGKSASCYKCAGVGHMAWQCRAGVRQEGEVKEWTRELGPNVEVFKPTYRTASMTDNQYEELREKNREENLRNHKKRMGEVVEPRAEGEPDVERQLRHQVNRLEMEARRKEAELEKAREDNQQQGEELVREKERGSKLEEENQSFRQNDRKDGRKDGDENPTQAQLRRKMVEREKEIKNMEEKWNNEVQLEREKNKELVDKIRGLQEMGQDVGRREQEGERDMISQARKEATEAVNKLKEAQMVLAGKEQEIETLKGKVQGQKGGEDERQQQQERLNEMEEEKVALVQERDEAVKNSEKSRQQVKDLKKKSKETERLKEELEMLLQGKEDRRSGSEGSQNQRVPPKLKKTKTGEGVGELDKGLSRTEKGVKDKELPPEVAGVEPDALEARDEDPGALGGLGPDQITQSTLPPWQDKYQSQRMDTSVSSNSSISINSAMEQLEAGDIPDVL